MGVGGEGAVCSTRGQGATRISLPSVTQEIKVPPDRIVLGEPSRRTASRSTMHTRTNFQFYIN